MERELACIDGHVVDVEAAVIPVTDPGLLRGDGVFEAIQLYDGVPYALDAHLERLARSASGLRLALDPDAFRADIAALLQARPDARGMVRIVATRGGRRIVLVEPPPERPQAVELEPVTYAPPRLLDGIKSLSYAPNMLAGRLARERGADDALLVTPHGRLLECPTAAFFLVRGGEVATAPLSEHILDSITRRLVLAVAAVREEPLELADLASAEEAFIAATPYEVMPVSRVGEHRYAAPGPRTSEVAALVSERIASELR